MTFYMIAPGTTPTHVFSSPVGEGIIKELQVTYSQNDKILVQKKLSDAEFFESEFAVRLTQEETLRFIPDNLVQIQVRILTDSGEAFASNTINAKAALSNSSNIIGAEGSKEKYGIKNLAPYFYTINYSDYDYEKANEYFEKYKPKIPAACSAVSNGNYFGRDYDWTYDDTVEFVIRTPATDSRHEVLGIAAGTHGMNPEFIESGYDSEFYDIVPFLLLDGINDAGLICEVNVVSADKGRTTGTNEDGEDMFAMMIPRYVLDYASSVDEAISLLREKNIYAANNSGASDEFHFMLADSEKTVVVEFVDNELSIVDEFVDGKPIMTNFHLTDYDGTFGSLTDYAMGIERYAILKNGYDESSSEKGMMALMKTVWYTGTYSASEDPLWFSEFSGNYGGKWGNLKKDTPHEDYMPLILYERNIYEHRQRDGKTWHTVHTSVYNREQMSLSVVPQESDAAFVFWM